jgi:hypothetical protein
VNDHSGSNVVPEHDVKSIVKGLIVALIVGLLVLVTIVWPAEYGKDPTGVGALLGLTIMSAEELAAVEAVPVELNKGASSANADAVAIGVESTSESVVSEKVIPITEWPMEDMDLALPENIEIHPKPYRNDHVEVTLQSGEAMEYKADLSQGEPLMFSWTATGGEIYTDLHAEPTINRDNYPEHYFYRYEEREDTESHGRFTAPFTGNHGWYLLNRNANPVTVRLEASGFYSSLKAIEKETQKPMK